MAPRTTMILGLMAYAPAALFCRAAWLAIQLDPEDLEVGESPAVQRAAFWFAVAIVVLLLGDVLALWHLWRHRPQMHEGHRTLWLLSLVTFGVVAVPVYWHLEVRATEAREG